MKLSFLVRRTLQIFALVFTLLVVIELVEGEALANALSFAAFWGVASAAVFAIVQRIRIRRGGSCEVCEGARAEQAEQEEAERASVLNM